MRDASLRDLRDSWRRTCRAPGTSFSVIASLGVAMAVSATVFSFVNALLLRTLSVSGPQRLVTVESTDPKTTQPTGFYGDAFAVFQASQTSCSAVPLRGWWAAIHRPLVSGSRSMASRWQSSGSQPPIRMASILSR